LIQEQQRLEDEQTKLFGIVLPREQLEDEVARASSLWLTPSALQNVIRSYLTQVCGGEAHIQGERAVKTLRLSQEARSRLLNDFRRLARLTSPVFREWEKWLKGADQRLDITFDGRCASENRGVVFITPVHPLVQQAASARADVSVPFRTAFRVAADQGVAAGRYPFAVYHWRRLGFRDDSQLQPVCAGPVSQETFIQLLQRAEPLHLSNDEFPAQPLFDELDSQHYSLWAQARAEHQDNVQQVARYRAESLRVSHEARVALLREQLSQSDNDRIRRMREGQLSNAEADYARRAEEIGVAEQRADIVCQPVAFGVLVVEDRQDG